MSAATTANKHTPQGIDILSRPVRAAVKIYDGSMVASLIATGNAGYILPAGSVGTAQKVLGLLRVRFDGSDCVDNTSGANGDLQGEIETQPAWIAQDGTITLANLDSFCYILDDSTVALTGSIPAGVIMAVDATKGVLVSFRSKPNFAPVAVTDNTTDGTAAAASASVSALAAETEKIGDVLRATVAALKTQGILS